MIRQSSDPASPYYAVYEEPGHTLLVASRTTFGGATSVTYDEAGPALPAYLMVQRRGDVLQAAVSTNGTSYTLLPGTDATVPMPAAEPGRRDGELGSAGHAGDGFRGRGHGGLAHDHAAGGPQRPRLPGRLELPGHRQPGSGRATSRCPGKPGRSAAPAVTSGAAPTSSVTSGRPPPATPRSVPG